MDYPISDASIGLINGKFSDGNPAGAVPASRDPARHMNAVTDEILNCIVQSGLTPAESNLTQLYQAVLRIAGGPVRAFSTSDWQRLASGLMLQWLRPIADFSGGATPSFAWPTAFPTACVFALAADFGINNSYFTVNPTASQFTLRSSTNVAGDVVSVFGIGY